MEITICQRHGALPLSLNAAMACGDLPSRTAAPGQALLIVGVERVRGANDKRRSAVASTVGSIRRPASVRARSHGRRRASYATRECAGFDIATAPTPAHRVYHPYAGARCRLLPPIIEVERPCQICS